MLQENELDALDTSASLNDTVILKENKGEWKKTAPRGKKLPRYLPGSVLDPYVVFTLFRRFQIFGPPIFVI